MVRPRFKPSTSGIKMYSLTATPNGVAKFWLTGIIIIIIIIIATTAFTRMFEHKNEAFV
jgi:hypothetical protein